MKTVHVLYCRGYFRNRKQLLGELNLPEDTGDTALLEAGYLRWGAGLPGHLYGSFAVALTDGETTVCFRDAMGGEPFFYCVTEDGTLLAGSDVNEILADKRYHREVDRRALQNYMNFGYPVGEGTLWKGICKLMPGRMLKVQAGKAALSAWYRPVYTPEYGRSEEEWAEEIGDTLRIILEEDRENTGLDRAGSFLSGGVDSSYLLALSGVRRAFGIGYPGEKVSEIPLAEKTARALGVSFSGLAISPEEYFDVIPVMVRRLGLPLADASAPAFAIGCERVARACDTCYSGEGADEFFAGYRIYRLADRLGQTGGPWHYGCAGVMEAEDAAQLLMQDRVYPCEDLVRDLYAETEGGEHLSRLLRIDCALWLEGDILFGVRRSSESCGLRLLLPYLDRRMFELSARIPSALKWKEGTEKYILRKAAEKRIPAETAFRPKTGFSVPVREWMRREPFRERMEALLFSDLSAHFLDRSRLRRYWTAFEAGNDALWQILYAAFVLIVWLREYGI